jgi:branched-chain amino acid transport system substrate-binding protein
MFSQGGEALASYDIGQRYAAKVTTGTTKIGLAYCVEASICTAQKNNFPEATKRLGYEVGPVQAVSLTQPDYTSECQAMKSADVKAVWIMVDGSAISRFLRSCSALGYNPTGITGVAAIGNPLAGNDANMRKNSMYMGGQVAPFVATDTPGAKEFHAAIDKYAPGLTVGQATMMGWSSGKLFEAALTKVATQARAGDVTTALVLDGLWALKNEKLDGLSPGVTFVKGKTAPPTKCAFIVAITKDGWAAPEGSKVECL